MEIEVGKKYITRDGRGPCEVYTLQYDDLYWVDIDGDYYLPYHKNGRPRVQSNRDFDLVAEWPEAQIVSLEPFNVGPKTRIFDILNAAQVDLPKEELPEELVINSSLWFQRIARIDNEGSIEFFVDKGNSEEQRVFWFRRAVPELIDWLIAHRKAGTFDR